MSGYPDKGNMQILLKAIRSTAPERAVKVEEIILDGPDPYAVADALRSLPGMESLSIMIYELHIGGETLYRLEAVIEYATDKNPSSQEAQSGLAKEILSKLGQHLADSSEWLFNPVGEPEMLAMLGLSADEIANAQLYRG